MKDNIPNLYPNEKVGERVIEYSDAKSTELPEVLIKYHDKISLREDSFYTISKFQAKTLSFLARMIGAKRVLEIGVYVGFSAMVWASGVGPDGKVTGLEFDPKFAEEAREGIKESGYSNIEIVTGNAHDTLPNLDASEPYDIIFLDANKASYPWYLRTIVDGSQPGIYPRILRPGGLIVADNVLRNGLVADSSEDNPAYYAKTAAGSAFRTPADLERLDEFNTIMCTHERLEGLLVPVFDGLGLARLVD